MDTSNPGSGQNMNMPVAVEACCMGLPNANNGRAIKDLTTLAVIGSKNAHAHVEHVRTHLRLAVMVVACRHGATLHVPFTTPK